MSQHGYQSRHGPMFYNNERRQQRIEETSVRNKEWSSLNPKEQLKSLDKRLGKNIGAKKQRERILNLIEKEKSDAKRKKRSEKSREEGD